MIIWHYISTNVQQILRTTLSHHHYCIWLNWANFLTLGRIEKGLLYRSLPYVSVLRGLYIQFSSLSNYRALQCVPILRVNPASNFCGCSSVPVLFVSRNDRTDFVAEFKQILSIANRTKRISEACREITGPPSIFALGPRNSRWRATVTEYVVRFRRRDSLSDDRFTFSPDVSEIQSLSCFVADSLNVFSGRVMTLEKSRNSLPFRTDNVLYFFFPRLFFFLH